MSPQTILLSLMGLLLAGSLVYCGIAIFATWRYLGVRLHRAKHLPPMSVLKPLYGLDEGLEENLRSFFAQDYPEFELLFAVSDPNDPAVGVVKRLQKQWPQVQSQLLVVGPPPYPNAKCWSLSHLVERAKHDLLVMADSDVRVGSGLLVTLAAEFADSNVALVTCPYRAVPGRSMWSLLEALYMNTEFLATAMTARLLDGMKFALGPTIAVRRTDLQQVGGFQELHQFLAEDFVMGQRVAALGRQVVFSRYVIEHHIGTADFAANMRHRLRWNRSTRRSRPWGYLGQVFTNPMPIAFAVWAFDVAALWWVPAITALVRGTLAVITSQFVLRDPLSRRFWLVVAADMVSAATWIAGLWGSTIEWRGRKYTVQADGKLRP